MTDTLRGVSFRDALAGIPGSDDPRVEAWTRMAESTREQLAPNSRSPIAAAIVYWAAAQLTIPRWGTPEAGLRPWRIVLASILRQRTARGYPLP